jgi:regulator of cell morphogenesis and NO signaling
MENCAKRSVVSLVLENHQIVPVLEKYSIDFCCRGKMSLEDACKENGIELTELLRDMAAVGAEEKGKQESFLEMTETQLVNHIVKTHHRYVKNAMPMISGHLEKVAAKHGASFPNMVRVKALFEVIHRDMDQHMKKEESILFPRILEMEKDGGHKNQFPAGYISDPITSMEQEHENAGDVLFEIRNLTQHYAVPPGACTTFRICLSELKEFEEDLHEHVHLENNILFPRAIQSCEALAISL